MVSKQRDDNLKMDHEVRSLKAERDSSVAEVNKVVLLLLFSCLLSALCRESCPDYI